MSFTSPTLRLFLSQGTQAVRAAADVVSDRQYPAYRPCHWHPARP